MTTVEQLYTHLQTLTKQWFYDKTEVDTLLNAKLEEADLPDVSDVIRTSNTEGLVKNDGTIDTTTYLEDERENGEEYLIIDDDETGFVKLTNGVVSYDTNTYLTTANASSTYVAKENGKGLFSGSYSDLTNIPETFAPGVHTHTVSDITDFSASASEVTDSSAYTNLGTSANATQHAINTAIDTKIGSLLSVELIEVVADLPTASADTLNALYLVAEDTTETNDAYEIFVTVEEDDDGTPSYVWEKVDTARIDLSGYALIDHTHGNITNDGKIGSTANQFVYTSTGGLVSAKASIGNITTDGAIGSTSGKVVTTTTDGVLTTSDWITEVDNVIQQLNTYGSSLNNNNS